MAAQVPVESGAGHGRAEQQASAEGGAPGAAEGGADRADCPAGHPDGWPACLGHGRLALLGAHSGLSPHRASQTAMRRPHDVISGHSYHVPSKLSLVALTHGLTSRWGGYNGRQVASAVAESLRTAGGQGLCGRAHAERAPAVGLRCTHSRHQEDAKQCVSMACKAAAPSWACAMAGGGFCEPWRGPSQPQSQQYSLCCPCSDAAGPTAKLLRFFGFVMLCQRLQQ